MIKFRLFVFILLFVFVGSLVVPVYAQTTITVVSNAASLTFPDSLIFNAEFKSGSDIRAVTLEYGVDQLTCGTVQAKAFPAVTPASDIKVTWTWDMRQSGSLPPGATVWWFWQVTDSGGAQFTSPKQSVVWLDTMHPWQTLTGGNINLHYYNGSASFGQQLHDAAVQALLRLSKDVGVSTDSPVDIYIYANSDDLQASILYAPTWVGGQAYPGNNIVIIGISPDELGWGKGTEAHELTHVLVGHLTFSCLGFIPTWLNEGLAVYGEGGPQAAGQALFDQAKSSNQLPSLRSLSGAFSAESDRANLSYAEAYSVVNFMLSSYGRDKMTSLLLDLRDGQTMDTALQAVYGFDEDGLENAWRVSIGASANSGSAQSTPLPTPTVVPTIVPIGAAPVAAAVVPTAQGQVTLTPSGLAQSATPGGTAQTPSNPSGNPPGNPSGISSSRLTTYLIYALVCLFVVVLLVGLIIFLVVRRRSGSSK